MGSQYFRERLNTSASVEKTDQATDSPLLNSAPFAGQGPAEAVLVHETQLGVTDAAVVPVDETLVHAPPMGETVPTKAPVGETVAVESQVSKSIPFKAPPMGETVTHEASIGPNAGSSAALLNREESERFRTRWSEIQGKFVDEPRSAVQQADALVSDVIGQITQKFATEHSSLEGQWNRGNDVSTEDLRKALQHYRSFFNRLVV